MLISASARNEASKPGCARIALNAQASRGAVMFTVGWFFTAAVNIPVGVNMASALGVSTWSLNIEIAPLYPRVQSVIEAGSEIATTSRPRRLMTVSYTHLRAHETVLDLVCRL